MPIKACQGCLKDRFLTTTEALNCFTGKQLWAWGTQYGGALGNNISSATGQSSPIQTIAGGNNWKQVSVGGRQSLLLTAVVTAAIKQDGTLWMWGNGEHGVLGDNTAVSKSSPVQTFAGGNNWKQVSVGASHAAAVKTDGTLWIWGVSSNGVLGDGTAASKSSPVQTISGGTNWKQVSLGCFHSAAIKTDGTLWTWGFGGNTLGGPLGDNTIVSKSSPVQTIAGGSNWRDVSSGALHVLAIKTDGSLWTWGSNSAGQLGNNSATNTCSPIQTISGGYNWSSISGGGSSSAAIKTDGTLWMWGCNAYGGLGDNTILNKSSPVQTISGGNSWRSVSLAQTMYMSSSAIKTDGTLWTWGRNNFGQLGNNTAINRSSPIQTISGGTSWKSTSSGFATAAIKEVEF